MKSKLNKVLFWASFIPYLLLVMNSFVSAINGTSVGFFGDNTMYYGAEAYSIAFVFTFLLLWFVFVAFLICQIIILLIEKIKKKSKIKLYVIGMIIIYAIGDIMLIL